VSTTLSARIVRYMAPRLYRLCRSNLLPWTIDDGQIVFTPRQSRILALSGCRPRRRGATETGDHRGEKEAGHRAGREQGFTA
jgi:hypothetical protein